LARTPGLHDVVGERGDGEGEGDSEGWDQIVAAVVVSHDREGEEGAEGGESEEGKAERKEELLLEGRKRWAAYRESQQQMEG